MGTQTVVHTADGFAANPLPGRLSFVRLVDEVRTRPHRTVPQLFVFLLGVEAVSSSVTVQGPELDTLNTIVTLNALCEVRFVEDFYRRAAAAPIIPDSGEQRNYTPLGHQLAEQAGRSLPGKFRRYTPRRTWKQLHQYLNPSSSRMTTRSLVTMRCVNES